MEKKKCCKASPPCKNCPKRKKSKARCAVDRDNCAICYFEPLVDISISGQRGCTAKSPACFAGVPA